MESQWFLFIKSQAGTIYFKAPVPHPSSIPSSPLPSSTCPLWAYGTWSRGGEGRLSPSSSPLTPGRKARGCALALGHPSSSPCLILHLFFRVRRRETGVPCFMGHGCSALSIGVAQVPVSARWQTPKYWPSCGTQGSIPQNLWESL